MAILGLLGGILLVAWILSAGQQAARVLVRLPDLTPEARQGQMLFSQHCAPCHGPRADGTDKGPPLVHPVYHPGHHADGAFALAVTNGVTAHHWPFGDMPPVQGITLQQIESLVRFVRELQRANGIY
ncbi:c-type cytochrome [Magnetospira thiophila]